MQTVAANVIFSMWLCFCTFAILAPETYFLSDFWRFFPTFQTDKYVFWVDELSFTSNVALRILNIFSLLLFSICKSRPENGNARSSRFIDHLALKTTEEIAIERAAKQQTMPWERILHDKRTRRRYGVVHDQEEEVQVSGGRVPGGVAGSAFCVRRPLREAQAPGWGQLSRYQQQVGDFATLLAQNKCGAQ